MKSKRLFCLFLAVILVFSLLGINAFADETYSFTTKGFGGDVTVTLTAIDGKITSLTATGPNESTDFGAKGIVYFNKLFSVYEGTELSQFDTSTIDAYTGATTTSNAVFTALNSVLAEVAESSTDASLADGTYTEMEWGFSLDTQLPVTVEIKNGAIASVTADLENGGETTHIARTAVERMIPRIIEEQSLSVDAITGATSSSNAIKNGISDALKEAMIAGGMAEKEAATALSGWYKVPSYMKTDDEPVDIQTQVVVVGGGGTGCLAAIQAQKTGADTLVIEKSGKYGGTGALTCGPLTINSPAQVEEFGNRDLVDADMLYTQWLEDIGAEEDSVNAEIISDFMGMSGYDIDWMDSMGFRKLIAATPFKFPAYQVWSTYDGWNSGKVHGDGNTHDFFDDLMKLYTNLGGKTMFETTGTAFLLDEVGKVIGVEAEGFDGQIYHIYADAVVLATGGYAGSSEYLKEFTLSDDTGVYQTYGIMTNVGTAISMARQVDGRISDNVDIVMAHFSAPEKRIHAFDPADNEIPTSIIVNEAMLDVDTNGDRFINETFASSDAGDETNRYLTIIGSDQIDAIKAEGFIGTTSGMYLNPGQISPGMPVENIYSVLDFCINAGFVWKADNLDDLAAAISADTGMPMSNLVSSVERYNEICAAGEDVDFGKDAAFLQPVTGNIYYAVEATPILYSTCSSVDVDASLRLLTNSGKPIENVFIGGVDSMGMVLSDEYIDYGGVAQSWAFYSGRLCGMNAAEYVINGTVPEADESYTITELGENTYNIIGTAPYMPACTLSNGDLPENGLNYVELTLPADSEAVTAVVRTITPYAGDFAVTEPNTEVPVTEGNFSYFLQINDSTVTAGGVVLGVEFDNGTTAEYTINTDFLTLAGNETSEDITVATNEAAAADPALNVSSFVNVGTLIRKAAADDSTVIYELSGVVSENKLLTETLGLNAENGEHYAAILLEAPEGFETGTFTVSDVVSYIGNELPVSRTEMPAVCGGAVYIQQFLPAVYEYAGFWGGESLISIGTLSEKGVTVSGTWSNGSETKDMIYKLGFKNLYMNFAPMDMAEALSAVGENAKAEITACDVNTYQVSETGTVNVMLYAPDPFFAYQCVTVNDMVMDCSPGYVVVPMDLAPGENTITAIWTGLSTFWGPGADYPLTYTFICA